MSVNDGAVFALGTDRGLGCMKRGEKRENELEMSIDSKKKLPSTNSFWPLF